MGKGEFAHPGMAIGNGVDVLCPREVGLLVPFSFSRGIKPSKSCSFCITIHQETKTKSSQSGQKKQVKLTRSIRTTSFLPDQHPIFKVSALPVPELLQRLTVY